MTNWRTLLKECSSKTFIAVSMLLVVGATVVTYGLGWFPGTGPKAEASQGDRDFVHLVRIMRTVVVHISVFKTDQGSQDPTGSFGGPLSEPSFAQEGLGSGFIIDSDGFILTNNHVVEDAEKIKVKLGDGREFGAKVVGKDPKTDIALLKIHAQENFPVTRLGDSDRLEVGEWVLAIGSPFGLDNTVTAGIVSAKDRNIGEGPYDHFIQTDASINPGNSGGPLINMHGEVVGINAAIFSETGDNIGIGFAVPINLVKEILPQLKAKGKVIRGWLGLAIQRVTPEIADALGLDKPRGALVTETKKNGPAGRAGILVGDLITEFDGREIQQSSDLPLIVARTTVGKEVRLKILRDKKQFIFYLTVGEAQDEETAGNLPPREGAGRRV